MGHTLKEIEEYYVKKKDSSENKGILWNSKSSKDGMFLYASNCVIVLENDERHNDSGPALIIFAGSNGDYKVSNKHYYVRGRLIHKHDFEYKMIRAKEKRRLEMESNDENKTDKTDRLKNRQKINANKEEILKEMETKIFNPPVVGDSVEDKYYGKLRGDLYTVLELHQQLLLNEAAVIDKGLYIEKLKAKAREDSNG